MNHNKQKDKTISIGEGTMAVYEFARWAALIEAVDIIANKCTERGIDFDKPEGLKFIKPLDIQDYVNTRTDSMVTTIERARTFEVQTTQTKIDTIKQRIYTYSQGDFGLPA